MACRIAVGSDHAGFDVKVELVNFLKDKNYEVKDVGTYSKDSTDYPDYAKQVAEAVSTGKADKGLLICYSGIGMSIAANKFKGVRAALCMAPDLAEFSRRHNDSNVLCLSAGFNSADANKKIAVKWLETPFEGGRHERRVNKIKDMEV